ncbi:unnamed protein product [Rhodiola kirilowii]
MDSGNGDDLRKFFVGGISSSTTEETLFNYFKQFGDVVGVNIPKNLSTGQSRGFGFVCFQQYDSAQRALNHPEHIINEKKVEVKPAKPKLSIDGSSDTWAGPTKKLFVGGLPYDCTTDELRAHFEAFGVVVDAIVMINAQTSKNRGFGFVIFDSDAAAANALKSPSQMLKNKLIEVKRAVHKPVNGSATNQQDSGNGHNTTNQHDIGNDNDGAFRGVVSSFNGYNMMQSGYNQPDNFNGYAVSPFQWYNMPPYGYNQQYWQAAYPMYPASAYCLYPYSPLNHYLPFHAAHGSSGSHGWSSTSLIPAVQVQPPQQNGHGATTQEFLQILENLNILPHGLPAEDVSQTPEDLSIEPDGLPAKDLSQTLGDSRGLLVQELPQISTHGLLAEDVSHTPEDLSIEPDGLPAEDLSQTLGDSRGLLVEELPQISTHGLLAEDLSQSLEDSSIEPQGLQAEDSPETIEDSTNGLPTEDLPQTLEDLSFESFLFSDDSIVTVRKSVTIHKWSGSNKGRVLP